jgi:hypothetical protein
VELAKALTLSIKEPNLTLEDATHANRVAPLFPTELNQFTEIIKQ